MAKQADAKAVQEYTVYADFELDGKTYAAGDVFVPAAKYERDANFEALRNISREKAPADGRYGIPFMYQVQVAQRRGEDNKLMPVMDDRRVILPVEEKASA